MKKPLSLFIFCLVAVASAVTIYAVFSLMTGPQSAILRPEGVIGEKQRDLIIFTSALMLIIIVPVFALTGWIVFRYREGKKSTYRPDWDHHRGLELIWWGFPLAIIVILGVVTWQSSHELDPYKPLASTTKPVKVQVVALQWKWLFIYPEQNIATVNYLMFPKKTPLNLEITADAPMNSFWIPKLGGQVYAMNGMTTKLHLEANNTGSYDGSSANISGEGFAEMRFKAHSVTKESFDKWVSSTQSSDKSLDFDSYATLSQPSKKVAPTFYQLSDTELYNKIIMKYMSPDDSRPTHGVYN